MIDVGEHARDLIAGAAGGLARTVARRETLEPIGEDADRPQKLEKGGQGQGRRNPANGRRMGGPSHGNEAAQSQAGARGGENLCPI
jgi:hypothetical protein